LKDPYGIPQLRIAVGYDDNDEKMVKDYLQQMTDMFEKAGFKNIKTYDSKQAAGLDIHEMGGVVWVKTLKHRYSTNGIKCTLVKTYL
jgi:hypothetical protein